MLTFINDINTREYIQYEQEIIVRKDIINNNNNHLQLHQKIGQYLEILKVPDQTYLTISLVVIFKYV